MRSSLNEGYSFSNPAKAWYRLRELIDELKDKQRQTDQFLLELAARLSAVEETRRGKHA